MSIGSRIPPKISELVASVALALAAVALSLWAIPLARFETTDVTVGEGRVAAVSRTTDLRHVGVVDLTWASPQPLYSTSTGLITAVSVAVGHDVSCGDVTHEVDARPVVLFCASRPLSGVIPDSSTDLETAAFLGFINSLGVHVPSDHISSTELTQAIVEFQNMVGQTPDGRVEPSDLLWSPAQLHVAQVQIHVGEPVSVGAVVMTSPARLMSANLTTARDVSSPSRDWVVDLDALGLAGLTTRSGGITDLVAVETSVLALYGNEAPPTGLDASIHLADPIQVVAIPPSALVADGATMCVVVDGSRTLRPVDVVIVGSEVDATYVISELVGGEMVVTSPDNARTC